MWRRMLVNFLLSVALAPPCMPQQKREYTTEAGIDVDGNIFVSSDEGKPIKMATVRHCIEARFADDKQTVGCSVARGTKPEEAMQSMWLEIYLRNGKLEVIETETRGPQNRLPGANLPVLVRARRIRHCQEI
jgi:hypothetical protein